MPEIVVPEIVSSMAQKIVSFVTPSNMGKKSDGKAKKEIDQEIYRIRSNIFALLNKKDIISVIKLVGWSSEQLDENDLEGLQDNLKDLRNATAQIDAEVKWYQSVRAGIKGLLERVDNMLEEAEAGNPLEWTFYLIHFNAAYMNMARRRIPDFTLAKQDLDVVIGENPIIILPKIQCDLEKAVHELREARCRKEALREDQKRSVRIYQGISRLQNRHGALLEEDKWAKNGTAMQQWHEEAIGVLCNLLREEKRESESFVRELYEFYPHFPRV